MKGILINGSPKRSDSASGALLDDFKSLLDPETEAVTVSISASHPAASASYTGMRWEPSPEDIKNFSDSRFLVLSFPLYVDGIPSHLLSFLSELEYQIRHGTLFNRVEPPAVYAIVNCGFYEGAQARHALCMVKNWCIRCGFEWKQGIGCGAGPMLSQMQGAPLMKGMKKPLGEALTDMAANLRQLKPGSNHLISPAFPRRLYIAAAHFGWKKQGRENGLSVKELKS